jgi:sodium/bile acid cotransporter 7
MGVPLAQLIFGARANLGLILLPIMFYHPFQLFVCGLLANRFASQQPKTGLTANREPESRPRKRGTLQERPTL